MVRLAGTLLLAATLAACGRHGASGAPAPEGELAIEVDNRYAGSLVIFLDGGGMARRLGEVHTQETRPFVVPWRWVAGTGGHVALRAEVIGSAEFVRTDDLHVEPGRIVRWTLAPNLRMSSWSVY